MISVIQVGTGRWGSSWTKNILPTAKPVDVTAYVDTSEEALAALQVEPGVPKSKCFTSLRVALDSAPCDIVLATLPTEAHFLVVQEALSADRHVLVEKPFTSTLEQALVLNRLAADRNRLLMVSQNYRFYSAPRTVAALLAQDRLGKPDSVSLDFRRHGPSMRFQYFDIPDPLIADQSIHHFDLMRMLFGEVERLSCRTWKHPGSPFRHDPSGVAIIEFVSGIVLSYRGSFESTGVETPWSGLWAINCSEGEILWACRGDQDADGCVTDWVKTRSLGKEAVDIALDTIPFYDRAGTIAALAQAVETGELPTFFTSGEDNIKSLALMEACVRSAAQRGNWVKLADVLPC